MTLSLETAQFGSLLGLKPHVRVSAPLAMTNKGADENDDPAELLARTLHGDRGAEARLFARFAPIIRKTVLRTFWLCGVRAQGNRNIGTELMDCEQQVCLALLDHDKRILRNFRPDVGSGQLDAYISGVTDRTTRKNLRRRRMIAPEVPTPIEEIPEPSSEQPDAEGKLLTRDLLRRVLAIIENELSPEAKELFMMHFIDDLDVPTICQRTGKSSESVWQWASRMRKVCARIAEKLDTPRRTP